jgi:TolB protein
VADLSPLPPRLRLRWTLWGANAGLALLLVGGVLWQLLTPEAVVATTVATVSTTSGIIQPLIEAVVPTQVAGVAIPRPSLPEPLAKPPGLILFGRGGAIWVWAGGEVRPLTPAGGNEQPRWSPDGTGIAYVHRDNSYSDIWIMDASGREARQITRNGNPVRSKSVWAFAPQWSPDGKSIAYLSDATNYDLALWQMDPTGNGAHRLSFLADYTGGVQDPAWSPSGDRLAAAAFLPDQPEQVYIFDLRANRWFPQTAASDGAYEPRFSPDGRFLVYVMRSQGKHDLWLLDLDTRANVQLTADGLSRAPVWSSTGDQILYLSGADNTWDIWILGLSVDATGRIGPTRPRPVTRDLRADPASGLSWWR